MEDLSIQRTERVFIRLGVKILCAIALLIGLGWGGREAFLRLQEYRMMKQARRSVEKHDDRWAAIAVRKVFDLNPKNAEACRLMAEILERQGANSAVIWRAEVVKLLPDSLDDAIALAKAALRFGDIPRAKRAIEKMEAKGARVAEFQEVKGEIALAQKDTAAAQAQFTEALRLDPDNKIFQLNLAIVQLQSKSADEKAKASQILQRFMEEPKLRKAAARALRDFALQSKDGRTAFEITQKLAGFPEAEFRDRLDYLQMLRQLNHPDFAVHLLNMEDESSSDPTKIYELLTWMSTNQQTVIAQDWVKRLPATVTSKWPVAGAVSDCFVAEKDWDGLEEWCKKTDWGEMDFLRHAALARASRERSRTFDAEREWNFVRKAIGSDGNKISLLQKKVAAWGWKQESLDLLWLLTKDQQRQNAAFGALSQYYAAEGDTASLYRVILHLSELRPNDPETENNLAQLSLLLNMDKQRAAGLAKKLYERDPTNAVFASTYAFSLFSQGQNAQALQAFGRVKAEDLRTPAVAAYYGIVLMANGDKAKAREFLEVGQTATLLPEERTLLARAVAAGASQ
jgi:tetratricopeptide (TPR) repeat protein